MWHTLATYISAHWQEIGTGLALFIVNTFISGLGKYPAAETFLQFVRDWLSMSTKKNSDGTWKLPFTRSKPPGDETPFKFTHKNNGAPKMISFICLMLILGILPVACATTHAVTSCTDNVAAAHVAQLAVLVHDIVENGTDFTADIEEIAADLGPDGMLIVECVISSVNKMDLSPKAKARVAAYFMKHPRQAK